ncbi:MAG: hypothetical protein PVJ67_00185 [Candidatus Pacearchaeota archaeon]|jgi:hypothetical protein
MEKGIDEKLNNEKNECKRVIESCLLESPYITINDASICNFDVDCIVADYLVKKGYERFLIKDVTEGFMVGGISESILREFAQEKKVFKGRVGDFTLREEYAVHSVRYFEAHHPD